MTAAASSQAECERQQPGGQREEGGGFGNGLYGKAVEGTRRHRAERADGYVALVILVRSPSDERSIGSKTEGESAACRNGTEITARHVALSIVIVAPSGKCAIGPNS